VDNLCEILNCFPKAILVVCTGHVCHTDYLLSSDVGNHFVCAIATVLAIVVKRATHTMARILWHLRLADVFRSLLNVMRTRLAAIHVHDVGQSMLGSLKKTFSIGLLRSMIACGRLSRQLTIFDALVSIVFNQ